MSHLLFFGLSCNSSQVPVKKKSRKAEKEVPLIEVTQKIPADTKKRKSEDKAKTIFLDLEGPQVCELLRDIQKARKKKEREKKEDSLVLSVFQSTEVGEQEKEEEEVLFYKANRAACVHFTSPFCPHCVVTVPA